MLRRSLVTGLWILTRSNMRDIGRAKLLSADDETGLAEAISRAFRRINHESGLARRIQQRWPSCTRGRGQDIQSRPASWAPIGLLRGVERRTASPGCG